MTDDRAWVEALPDLARVVLPAPVAAYVESGADADITRDEATAAWRRLRFAPRVLQEVNRVDLSVTLLGQHLRTPIGVAPTSMQRAGHPEGERAMARGAAEAGALHVVSSNASHPFEEIGDGPWWLQLYAPADRSAAVALARRAVAAGASALVLTVDTPVPGPKPLVRDEDWQALDISWHRANLPPEADPPWAADLSVADLEALRAAVDVPLVVKGVLRPDDARRCVEAGAGAVWVSNHGGRQLDRSIATADALPGVVADVGGDAEVYVDGGLRSGLDVLAALALGADAVFLGRPPFWALAVAGSDGVRRLLDVLGQELAQAMALAGAPTVASTEGLIG